MTPRYPRGSGVMRAPAQIAVVDSRNEPAASCVVCGNEFPAGEGVTARYRGRTLRFRCPGCLTRFRSDPERFLAGQGTGCCGEVGLPPSRASEWTCD